MEHLVNIQTCSEEERMNMHIRIKVFICAKNIQTLKDADTKILNTVRFVCDKMREMVDDKDCRYFEIFSELTNISTEEEALKLKQNDSATVNMFFFVGNYRTIKAYNQAIDCFFEIPLNNIMKLPLILSEKFSRSEKDAFGVLAGYVSHELFHAFGAFHSSHGIMSGRLNIFENPETTLQSFSFKDYTDFITERILVEMLCKPISIISNFNVSTNRAKTHIQYENSGETGISAYGFISSHKYTNNFKLYSYNEQVTNFCVKLPPDADGFFVIHFTGPYIYFKRISQNDAKFSFYKNPL